MRITLLCSDHSHPVIPYLNRWMALHSDKHNIQIVQSKSMVSGGEILFLISCSEIITMKDREKYHISLVLHASDLPQGRGWSPHIWELSQGADHITLSLLEAEDKVDTGKIWKKIRIPIPKHALWDEINHLLFEAELELMSFAVENFGIITPEPQPQHHPVTYYPRRTPKNSEININKGISEQFDLIRVCDPNRYPAYFYHLGNRYTIKIEKHNEI